MRQRNTALTVLTKKRDRLLTTEMSQKVMAAILAHREVAPLLSDEHFSVHDTLVKAWASMKSFQPKLWEAPSDNDGPGVPPRDAAPAGALQAPATPEANSMPRNSRSRRNPEVDFRGHGKHAIRNCFKLLH